MNVGACTNSGSVVQKSAGIRIRDARADMECEEEVRSDYVSRIVVAGSTTTAIKFEDFDAGGFTATWEGHDGDANSYFGYLALSFSDGRSAWCDIIDTLGFTPAFLLLIGTMVDDVDTGETTGPEAGTIGFGVATSVDEYSHSAQDEDAAATSNTQSMTDAVVMNLPQDDGTAGIVAERSSFGSGEFVLDFTTADGTARKWVAMAIGTPGGVATILPQMMMHEG
jgi:hypothetical protein